MHEPTVRRIGIVPTDRAQRSARDKAHCAPQPGQACLAKRARWTLRRNSGAPKNFISHPVANPGKAALQQKHGFDRCTIMSPDESGHKLASESG
jgi:hypothetical protein